MRVVAMVSGGKDSCYNMMQCVAEGHEIVALANLHPKDRDELDSFMYQTVGHMGIEILAKAMDLPLYRQEIKGKSCQRGKQYVPMDNDEVEDLYNLLALCKEELKAEAVAVGAILSDYQRVRVENVCSRLNLVSLAYLWRRDQTELLQEMIDCHVHAILIKVATLGLLPDRHLGKSLKEIQTHLLKMRDKYGLNVCGEGGEYETFTLDCPLFRHRIVVDEIQTVISSSNPICPVGYINFTKLSLSPKETQQSCDVLVKKSLDYIIELSESTYGYLNDSDLSETGLEIMEKKTRVHESLSRNEFISLGSSFGKHLNTSPSPVPTVTKIASVDDQSPSALLSSSSALCTDSLCSGICSFTLSTHGAGYAGLDDEMPSQIGKQLSIQATNQFKFEREFRPLNNRPIVSINQKGWMWVAGVQGCATNSEKAMYQALDCLHSLAVEHNYEMNNYCYVTMYVRSISDYATINRIYGQVLNFQNPPTRVCVECPLPENCYVVLEAIAFKAPLCRTATIPFQESGIRDDQLCIDNSCSSSSSNVASYKRNTMHVQSISHWAPANIGPYSQSTKIDEITYISGQIALVPGSMTIIEGGIRPQCKLTLRHISRIAKAMNAQGQLRDVVHGICFVTHPTFITEARHQWEKRTTNSIMDYIVVPALPREALVEWQVWAHTHNDRFEYEETGCSIGDYTISIRRRWNYENNCAAIICYISTGLAPSATELYQLPDDILINHCRLAQNLTSENMDEILSYVLNRLLKDYPLVKNSEPLETLSSSTNHRQRQYQQQEKQQPFNIPAIHLKVFYQVTATPSIDLLFTTLNNFRQKCKNIANIAFTVLPACSLHNFSTFLSLCGVRHE